MDLGDSQKGYFIALEESTINAYAETLEKFIVFLSAAVFADIDIPHLDLEVFKAFIEAPSLLGLENFIIRTNVPMESENSHPLCSFFFVFSRKETRAFESIEKIRHMVIHFLYAFRLAVFIKISRDETTPAERDSLLASLKWK